MEISEIREGMSNISLQAKVVEVSEVREVVTRFGRRNVADAILEDASGQINLTLWQEQIDKVKVGDRVKIEGAFATKFKDKLQLSIPRSGKIEVVE